MKVNNLVAGLDMGVVLRSLCFLLFVGMIFIAPDVMAQSLPQPPDGMGGNDGDWMASIGKLAHRGGGIVLIIIALGAAIGCVWYIVSVINKIRTNKGDLADLGIAVMISAVGLGLVALFANYGLKILTDNQSFLGG